MHCWPSAKLVAKLALAARQATATCARQQATDTSSLMTLSICRVGSYPKNTYPSSPRTLDAAWTHSNNYLSLLFLSGKANDLWDAANHFNELILRRTTTCNRNINEYYLTTRTTKSTRSTLPLGAALMSATASELHVSQTWLIHEVAFFPL